jgi:hypothetical protein
MLIELRRNTTKRATSPPNRDEMLDAWTDEFCPCRGEHRMTEQVFATVPRSSQETERLAASFPGEQRVAFAANGAWGEFLRKILPPVSSEPSLRMVRTARA